VKSGKKGGGGRLYGVYRHESRIKNHPLFLRNRSFVALRALMLYHTSSPSQNLSPCNSLNRNYSLRYQEFSMHFSILIFQSIDIFTYPSKLKKFDRKCLVKIYVICQVSMAARLRLRLLYKLISVPSPTLGNRKPSIHPSSFFSFMNSLFLFEMTMPYITVSLRETRLAGACSRNQRSGSLNRKARRRCMRLRV
jgi:hypothetical protein